MHYSICLLGNSHLAALALAWRADRLGASPEVSLTFFGSPASTSLNVELKDGALIPAEEKVAESWRRTSGGEDSIILRAYDAFVLYGLGFSLYRLLQELEDYGTLDELAWGPVKHLVSRDCMHAILRSEIEKASALDLLRQIKSVTASPVLLCPLPFRPENPVSEDVTNRSRLSNPEVLRSVVCQFHNKAAEVCETAGSAFISQDESTWALPGFTRAEFVLGGENWSGKNNTGTHMNARYGAIMLAKILRCLDDLSKGRVLAAAD